MFWDSKLQHTTSLPFVICYRLSSKYKHTSCTCWWMVSQTTKRMKGWGSAKHNQQQSCSHLDTNSVLKWTHGWSVTEKALKWRNKLFWCVIDRALEVYQDTSPTFTAETWMISDVIDLKISGVMYELGLKGCLFWSLIVQDVLKVGFWTVWPEEQYMPGSRRGWKKKKAR